MNLETLKESVEKIKEGIQQNDMVKIVAGYNQLTGENIHAGGIEPKEEVMQEQMQEEVQELPEKKEAKSSELDFTIKRKDTTSKSKYTKSEKIVAGENKFVDDGSEHMEDSTPDYTPTKRNRSPVQFKEVRCHVCGETESVHPSTVGGAFRRCSRCI